MILELNQREIELCAAAGIEIYPGKDYSEEELFELLELIYDQEARYSNYPAADKAAYELFDQYAALADKIQGLIPGD